jgi:hypothetical protein
MKRAKPFADIVAELSAQPKVQRQVTPGEHNRQGDLFDPAGRLLTKAHEITTAEARESVLNGSQLAFEGCGCGGWSGCMPIWIGADERREIAARSKPRFVKKHGSPTWIELWHSDDGSVVYAHGDVEWGDALV